MSIQWVTNFSAGRWRIVNGSVEAIDRDHRDDDNEVQGRPNYGAGGYSYCRSTLYCQLQGLSGHT